MGTIAGVIRVDALAAAAAAAVAVKSRELSVTRRSRQMWSLSDAPD